MVSSDIIPAVSDEYLMEDIVSKVETVLEDECDLPVQVEESRNPSPATAQETEDVPAVATPKTDTSDASTTPTSDKVGNSFRRDGAEAANPSSGNFWFRKQAQSEQDTVNLAALRDLDESAKKNEEIGTSSNRRQNARWWRFGAPNDEKPNPNDARRQYRDAPSTPEGGSPSSPQGGAHSETAIVVRSEPVNVLWNVMSEAVRRSALWRATTRVQESSRAAADQRAKQGAAMRHGIRKFFRRRNADEQANAESETEKQATGSRQPWWRRFRRNRSQVEQSSADGETSTALVPYAEPHPVATAMKKAAAGVTGTCMVIVGVPLLLFPVPGPGVAMIASGVYVVSTEFEFARSWLESVKNRFGSVFDRLGIEVATPEALPQQQGPAPPVLALPPSLPPADADENVKDSNDEEETSDSKPEESIAKDENDMPLPASNEKEEVENATNTVEAVTMRI